MTRKLTGQQLDQLIRIVDTKRPRNWAWLARWLDGDYSTGFSPKEIIDLYEADEGWSSAEVYRKDIANYFTEKRRFREPPRR